MSEQMQTVADGSDETQEAPKPAAASGGAGDGGDGGSETGAQDDDLNSLLAEYDEAATQTNGADMSGQDKPDESADDDRSKITQAVAEALEQREMQQRAQSDFKAFISTVRGEEMDAETFDDDFVESWIETLARKDKRYVSAWANRRRDPDNWQKVERLVARQFQDRFSKVIDGKATEDRAAVAASVRSASKQQSDAPPDFNKMSDAEFQNWKMAHR